MSDDEKWPIQNLIQDEHYYLEKGFLVFTEKYHLVRGYCCGNSCRHCPYSHKNVKKKKNIEKINDDP
tara:strand:+ start:234 stop:434 length:201 start_codon:yes stop_codon:yes gene_type:complete